MSQLTNENFNGDITSGENKSYWVSTVHPLVFEKLRHNIETDVLVIGGGISGLTAAYCLLVTGHKVTLVEDGFIGSGETGRSTAHISYALDDHFTELGKIFGNSKAALAASSHMAAIGWIGKIIHTEDIDCDFRRVPGYLFLGENDTAEHLRKEFESTKDAGLPTELLEHVPGIRLPYEADTMCIRYPDQAQFHPMKYLNGLAEAVIRKGGNIYTQTRAEEISEKGAKANGYEINARHIVVATNTPVNDRITMHLKQHAYRTYVIAAKIPRGQLPYSLWWDTGNNDSKWVSEPYHYIRLHEYNKDFDLLISGGEDHKVGQEEKDDTGESRFTKLFKWTKERFPWIENIEYKWSGQIMEPVDSIAFIGRNPGNDNIYIITGDSGDGITHGTIGGILVTDLINGKENRWADLYDPARITVKTTGDFLQEAGNMTAQYFDWISKGDIKESEDLKPGMGAIMNSGLKKIAVYRDPRNNLHACSAVCPHLGGVLTWNNYEGSFDCPVHGSRFTAKGIVINGPAISNLKVVEIKDDATAQPVTHVGTSQSEKHPTDDIE
jgi:glycine/D-amino acid oxidase-like deaminating enzyme/Rieske Fe-S protein